MSKMIDEQTGELFDQWIDTGSGPGYTIKRKRPPAEELARWMAASQVMMGLPAERAEDYDANCTP